MTYIPLDQLLSVIITLGVCAAGFFGFVGRPYLVYISLVTKAFNDEGVIALAKYLARQTGGRGIDIEDIWEEFVPAARAIYKAHLRKIETSS